MDRFSNLFKQIERASETLKDVAVKTPLQKNQRLSHRFGCEIWLKREDLQPVRSYKIRGAYNLISSLTPKQRKKGVVAASAGNHAQGVALSCNLLDTHGVIFMPRTTPAQKIRRVEALGGKKITLKIQGDSFDESSDLAKKFCKQQGYSFVHPFDDLRTIAGQGTVATEIFSQLRKTPDFIVCPVGGGGLISGVSVCAKNMSPKTKILGAEPLGAPGMEQSLRANKLIKLQHLDKFVDGAAVKQVGRRAFEIAKKLVQKVLLVPENKICAEMLELYQKDGIIAEPAGALATSVLDQIKHQIKHKTVVCVLSGGNNDVTRYGEIMERALIYKGLKHYFIINFAQRPGALRRYLDRALGPNDITLFEYVKKNNREEGPALIGVELTGKREFKPMLARMNKIGLDYEIIKPDSPLYRFLI